MSEKTNFKKLDYQERVLNSKEKFICEDWERGTGKTTTLLRKVLKPNTSVLWVANTETQFNMLIDKLKHEFNLKYYFDNSIDKRNIKVYLKDGVCTLYNYVYAKEEINSSYRGSNLKIDNVVVDDVDVKFDINFKNQIDIIIKPMLKDDGQIIHLYTSMKNNNKGYQTIERKISYENNLYEILAYEINRVIKPNAKILIIGNDERDFSSIMSSIDNEKLKLCNNYGTKYDLEEHGEVPINFLTLNSNCIRGRRFTDVFIVDIDMSKERNIGILGECIFPFIIPNFSTNQSTITHITKEEQKTDRYKILDDQIDILLEELDNTQKSSNTTMTREKIINMIDRLYKIKELEK